MQRVSRCDPTHCPPPHADQGGIQVEPGKPDQFCSLMESLDNATPLYVSTYPVAWRIEVVDDDKHVEYARLELDVTRGVEVVR